MKRIAPLMLALALLLCALPAHAVYDRLLGLPFPDFTVETTEGDEITLSKLLEEKELVVLNLFASWCPPCRQEFPEMDAVYRGLSDRIEIVALSADANDTMDVVRDYKAELDLSFPMGVEAGTGILDFVPLDAYPSNLFIDRFGNVGFIYYTFADEAQFARAVNAFLGEDYTQTRTYADVPPADYEGEYPDESALSDALNAEGGALAFRHDPAGAAYPFRPYVLEGRNVAVAENDAAGSSLAYAETTVTAAEGDALAFDFALNADARQARLEIRVDGAVAKVFSDAHPWMSSWALPLAPGEHTVALAFNRFGDAQAQGYSAMFDDVRLLHGEDARAALAALPEYPVSEDFAIRLLNDGAREVMLTMGGEDTGVRYWVAPGPALRLAFDAPADVDPEAAVVFVSASRSLYTLAKVLENSGGAGYELSLEPQPGEYAIVEYVDDIAGIAGTDRYLTQIYAADDEGARAVCDLYRAAGYDVDWAYVDGGDAAAQGEAEATYTVAVVDQDGAPVPDAYVSFCTDETCQTAQSGEDGVITFVGAPQAYHLQILKLPEGYSFDAQEEIWTEAGSCALTIRVNRD